MTQEQIDALTANEQLWWDAGSALCEAADLVRNPEVGLSRAVLVGKPIAGRVSPNNEYHRWRRSLVADMLYAFAVEDWLKGLLVMQVERGSDQKRSEVSRRLSELVSGDEEDYIRAILEALDTPDMARIVADYERERSDEDRTRRSAAEGHGHGLVRLAEAAGLVIDGEVAAYLRALGIVNQLGRYPLHRKENDGDLTPFVGNDSLREKLNGLLHDRYLALDPDG